ncbi:hypothetical protein K0U83_09370 [bacterium]|nr:hypothetical protein [bacterium]
MTFPVFASGDVLNASDMNGVGLWLVKSQAVGSGVASVTVTGAFSADYQNYRIIYTGGTASGAAQALNLRLGAATTNYHNSALYAIYAGGTGSVTYNNTQTSFVYAGSADATVGTFLTVDLFNPFDSTKYTGFGGSFIVTDVAGHTGGVHKSNTSFTDFTLLPGTGTLTGGTIRVYGYRN